MSGSKEKEKRKEEEAIIAEFDEAVKNGPQGNLADENVYECMGWVYGFLCNVERQGKKVNSIDMTKVIIAAEMEFRKRKEVPLVVPEEKKIIT